MENYSRQIQVRWSDIDQNRHLRHSVYYDFGAFIRITFLSEHGLTSAKLEELNIGPVIFREEAIFKREISLEDLVTINVELVSSTSDYSRWSLRHNFIKAGGVLAAVLNLDGAWIDITKRKLTTPGEAIKIAFDAFPKSPDFRMIEKNAVSGKA